MVAGQLQDVAVHSCSLPYDRLLYDNLQTYSSIFACCSRCSDVKSHFESFVDRQDDLPFRCHELKVVDTDLLWCHVVTP